jgi:hypothetical protein
MEFARENFEAVFSENLAKIHVKKVLCNLQTKNFQFRARNRQIRCDRICDNYF